MEKLWAPWRMTYIKKAKEEKGCLFCKKLEEGRDEENYILHRSKLAFVILNIFPYNSGHLMVVPIRHVGEVEELKVGESKEMMALLQRSIIALKRAYKPEGLNIGMNLGRTAGAGVLHHLHIHVVPRWNGDTNFMPILAESKIISQSLRETFTTLRKVMKKSQILKRRRSNEKD